MKCQALFSLKNNKNKNRMLSASILLCTVRIKTAQYIACRYSLELPQSDESGMYLKNIFTVFNLITAPCA